MPRSQNAGPIRYFVQQSFDNGQHWTSHDGFRTARYSLAVSHAQRWVVEAMRDGHFYKHLVRIVDQLRKKTLLEITVANAEPAEADYDDAGNFIGTLSA
jgi:hypothetical protein